MTLNQVPKYVCVKQDDSDGSEFASSFPQDLFLKQIPGTD